MKGTTFGASLLALASSAIATSTAVLSARDSFPTVGIKGNAFVKADGSRFYIRGVAYQPGGSSDPVDPIADPSICKRDIPKFQALGVNTIRVYTIDNSKNHDECMSALQDAGIYLALDVNSGKYSLNRNDPGPSYNNVYLQSVFATIDAFQSYPNTLLFFSGNEVINNADNTNAAPYVKAVTRDMKQYIGSRGYRSIPVGYSAADVPSNRYILADYMNCGTSDERSDFYSFNDYEWCPPSSFTESGWSTAVQELKNYSIPLFLSEFGCNHKTPRTFQEISALYNEEMTGVYSGGLVYEYSEEQSPPNFGLVKISGSSVSELTDYKNLQAQYAKYPSPNGDGGARLSDAGEPASCPPRSSAWNVPGDALPAIPDPAKKYFTSGAGKGPGLSGPGSQDAGTQSTGTATPGSGAVSGSPGASGSGSGSSAATFRPGPFEFGPLISIMVFVFSGLFGATLL